MLHGIDLDLKRGDFCAVMGPSGSGKSTLLNIIGLLDRPTSGTVAISGVPTVGLEDRALTRLRGHNIGFVFQYHHLLTAFTALENVMMPMLGDVGFPTADMMSRAADAARPRRAHAMARSTGGAAVRRAAAARGGGACAGHEARAAARRRAHGQPRHEECRCRVCVAARRSISPQGTTVLFVTHNRVDGGRGAIAPSTSSTAGSSHASTERQTPGRDLRAVGRLSSPPPPVSAPHDRLVR
ncbi:MAG: ATP-binding cassette domain-containing protein [Gemmatimonadaceae bacterium]|nr:ATP-binding cassette domain-containing protein [Gemmatimonadaceae bacterium]